MPYRYPAKHGFGGTVWQGRPTLRISASWGTLDQDVHALVQLLADLYAVTGQTGTLE